MNRRGDTFGLVNTDQLKLRFVGGFRPFLMHLSDGRTFRVPHPEFILIGKKIVVVLREDDLAETIDPLHIVSVEDLESAA